jgi:RNase H-fold protein (predicted Holliday junction resolvase)
MFNLGQALGEQLIQEIEPDQHQVFLAATVEDADFLAQGILNQLEKHIQSVGFACFWNQRTAPFEIDELSAAPILKKYQEPANQVDVLIIVKSIISGACVVRTNLENLIQKIKPTKILIVAPVIYYKAEANLSREFEPEISQKFQFVYFAKDNERTEEGEVVPGIGGMIYERLGFRGQEEKNSYIPEIVKARRARFISSAAT